RYAGFHLLHRLVAGECAERIDVGPLVHQAPEFFSAAFCERVLDLDAAAQLHYVGRAVAALHALPARVLSPLLLERLNLFFSLHVSLRELSTEGSVRGAYGAQQHAMWPICPLQKQGFT